MQRKLKQAKRHLIGAIRGTSSRPRLVVFRSNKYIYGQIIDDTLGTTLASVDGPTADAKSIGLLLASRAKEKKVTTVVFDRNEYKYHGKIKAFAEGSREGGLQF